MSIAWTAHNTIVLAGAVSASLGAALWWSSDDRRFRTLRDRALASGARCDALIVAAAATLFFVIFVVYRFPVAGDVALYYVPFGRRALEGGFPGSDFHTLYMPGFVYLMGFLDLFGRLGIPAFMTFSYATALMLARRILERAGIPGLEARKLVLAGGFTGGACILSIGFQQDESIMLLLLLLAALALASGRPFAAGLILGFGLLATKILFVIPAAASAWVSRRRPRALAGFACAAVPALALAALRGFDPLTNLLHDHGPVLAFPSLSATIITFAARRPETASTAASIAIAATCVACAAVILSAPRRRWTPLRAMTLTWVAFVLLDPRAVPPYHVLILPLLPAQLEPLRARGMRFIPWLLALQSAAIAIQPMLFWDWFGRPYGECLRRNGPTPELALMLLVDGVVLVADIAWFLLLARPGAAQDA